MIATFDPGRVAALRAELDRLVESGEDAGFSGLSYAELGNLLDDARFAAKAAIWIKLYAPFVRLAPEEFIIEEARHRAIDDLRALFQECCEGVGG